MSAEDVLVFLLFSTRIYILMNEHVWPSDVMELYNIRGNMLGFCDDALSSGCEDSSIGRSEFSFTKLSVSCKQNPRAFHSERHCAGRRLIFSAFFSFAVTFQSSTKGFHIFPFPLLDSQTFQL